MFRLPRQYTEVLTAISFWFFYLSAGFLDSCFLLHITFLASWRQVDGRSISWNFGWVFTWLLHRTVLLVFRVSTGFTEVKALRDLANEHHFEGLNIESACLSYFSLSSLTFILIACNSVIENVRLIFLSCYFFKEHQGLSTVLGMVQVETPFCDELNMQWKRTSQLTV